MICQSVKKEILSGIYQLMQENSIISLEDKNVLLVESANTALTLLCAIKSCAKKACTINVAIPAIANKRHK